MIPTLSILMSMSTVKRHFLATSSQALVGCRRRDEKDEERELRLEQDANMFAAYVMLAHWRDFLLLRLNNDLRCLEMYGGRSTCISPYFPGNL